MWSLSQDKRPCTYSPGWGWGSQRLFLCPPVCSSTHSRVASSLNPGWMSSQLNPQPSPIMGSASGPNCAPHQSSVKKGTGLGEESNSGSKFRVHHLQHCHLTSNLSFYICKMGIKIPILQGRQSNEIKGEHVFIMW